MALYYPGVQSLTTSAIRFLIFGPTVRCNIRDLGWLEMHS